MQFYIFCYDYCKQTKYRSPKLEPWITQCRNSETKTHTVRNGRAFMQSINAIHFPRVASQFQHFSSGSAIDIITALHRKIRVVLRQHKAVCARWINNHRSWSLETEFDRFSLHPDLHRGCGSGTACIGREIRVLFEIILILYLTDR